VPIPDKDTAHVVEGVNLLTSRYKALTVTPGIIRALCERFQEIENDYWSFIGGVQLANHPMGGGPWDVLDKIGAIVGIARNGLDDTHYLAAIKIKIRVNRSHGLAEDIIQIAALLVSGATYVEYYPASFEVDIYNITADVAFALIRYLGAARSAGTQGLLRYTLWPLSTDIIWGDTYSVLSSARGFSSSYGGAPNNVFASLQLVQK
jgi:hypothetical protein